MARCSKPAADAGVTRKLAKAIGLDPGAPCRSLLRCEVLIASDACRRDPIVNRVSSRVTATIATVASPPPAQACSRDFTVRSASAFPGYRWPADVILMAVGWYLRHPLSATS